MKKSKKTIESVKGYLEKRLTVDSDRNMDFSETVLKKKARRFVVDESQDLEFGFCSLEFSQKVTEKYLWSQYGERFDINNKWHVEILSDIHIKASQAKCHFLKYTVERDVLKMLKDFKEWKYKTA